ncbi:hypothetical protein R3P38DRAFT_1630756 [Favolaschia claudopus]|uniref:Uncharacterized protein n=1 Tax=Favolaschia claudopus TaxID=2862362 RepID=A0AAW0DLN7_9AGAR
MSSSFKPSSSKKTLHISLPHPSLLSAPTHPPALTRLLSLAAELLFTTGCSFLILLALLRLFGLVIGPNPQFTVTADPTPLSVLRVTVVCTLVVYFGVECCAAVLARMRGRRIDDYEYEYGYEAAFFEEVDGATAPFTMKPAVPRQVINEV